MQAREPLSCLRNIDKRSRGILAFHDLTETEVRRELRNTVDILGDLGELFANAAPFGTLSETQNDENHIEAMVSTVIQRIYTDRPTRISVIEGGKEAVAAGRLAIVDGVYTIPLDGASSTKNWLTVFGFILDILKNIVDRFRSVRGRIHTQPSISPVKETLAETAVRMLESLRSTVGCIVGTNRRVTRTITNEDPLVLARWSGEQLIRNEQ